MSLRDIVFEVKLENQENVYMSVSRSNYMDEERCIVIVDAEKFLGLWRNDPYSIHSDISHGNIETWRNDKKYHHAVQGFSYGIKNPVPVANVVCHKHTKKIPIYRTKFLVLKELIGIEEAVIDFVRFINGITRTIWLLVHGARYFPVECSIREGADRLAEIAGYFGTQYRTVEQLTQLTMNT